MTHRALTLLALAALLACGDDDADPIDAGGDTGSTVCVDDGACDDGLFCNGAETCAPDAAGADARGCMPGDAPCAMSACDEAADRCDDCGITADVDGDGFDAIACGGEDCDDDDPDRFPGNPERCDDVDQDCDPNTLGFLDADRDGSVSASCCNGERCGGDCDDDDVARRIGQLELCDEVDNDCDGSVDEDTATASWYEDRDGDGFGVATASLASCVPPAGYSLLGTDCDDGDTSISPVGVERCDEVDQDCDGSVDEGVCATCTPRAEDCDGVDDDCDDVIDEGDVCATGCVPAAERCNGRDDDCDDAVDEGVECAISPETIVDVSAGLKHTCAIDGMGRVFCWGANASGQVSPPAGADVLVPRLVSGLEGVFVEVAAGGFSTCARRVDGRVFCWGENEHGEIGAGADPETMPQLPPTQVVGITNAVQLAGGYWNHCARLADGSVRCWGQNESGELGQGTDGDLSSTPLQVMRLGERVTDLSFFIGAGCAVRDGNALCWGYNVEGMVGNGTTNNQLVPSTLVELEGPRVSAVGVGGADDGGAIRYYGTSCAIADGTVWCWGSERDGAAGSGTAPTTEPILRPQDTGFAAVEIEVGGRHACARTAAG
ncbi:MAG TPA: MopE-related protein, partial [Polyangiaceae bacterium LLY-WYZ-15_(1-7)]|nr:MopE-related protein [Polyangiaceae bacterium LLY-WYZ-15_(1-7)]